MQPEKYLSDLESSRRRQSFLTTVALSLLFLLCFYILGPVIHEFGHLAVLESISCPRYINLGFNFLGGLHASITPLCSPAKSVLVVFYSVGYLSTLLVAAFTSIIALRERFGAKYLAAAASGLYLSILLSVGVEGDIKNLVKTLGWGKSSALAAVIFVVLGVFISSLKTIQFFLDLEGKE